MGGSISFHNKTQLPLVFVISQVGPLYWGVLQPGESAHRDTGRVWFTIDIYPYDGKNEPTHLSAVLSIAIPTGAAILAAVTAGFAAIPAAGSYAAVLAPIAGSTIVPEALAAGFGAALGTGGVLATGVAKAIESSTHPIHMVGYYVGGDETITIEGGPRSGVPHNEWKPISCNR